MRGGPLTDKPRVIPATPAPVEIADMTEVESATPVFKAAAHKMEKVFAAIAKRARKMPTAISPATSRKKVPTIFLSIGKTLNITTVIPP